MSFASINFPEISLPALFLISLSGIVLLTGRGVRWLALFLGLQYVGVFLLVYLSWSVTLAAAKLVAGWVAAVLLGVGIASLPNVRMNADRFSPSGRIFRLLVAFLVWLTMVALASRLQVWFPHVGLEILVGSLLMIGLGALNLGLTVQPLRVIAGLLTVLGGFEILYAALENSILVAGLLASLNLGLALVGLYLLAASDSGDEP